MAPDRGRSLVQLVCQCHAASGRNAESGQGDSAQDTAPLYQRHLRAASGSGSGTWQPHPTPLDNTDRFRLYTGQTMSLQEERMPQVIGGEIGNIDADKWSCGDCADAGQEYKEEGPRSSCTASAPTRRSTSTATPKKGSCAPCPNSAERTGRRATRNPPRPPSTPPPLRVNGQATVRPERSPIGAKSKDIPDLQPLSRITRPWRGTGGNPFCQYHKNSVLPLVPRSGDSIRPLGITPQAAA